VRDFRGCGRELVGRRGATDPDRPWENKGKRGRNPDLRISGRWRGLRRYGSASPGSGLAFGRAGLGRQV